jgi:hypothetical protein
MYLVSLQLLTIHLDESDCFSAWVSAKELGIKPSTEGVDNKCKRNSNYQKMGGILKGDIDTD